MTRNQLKLIAAHLNVNVSDIKSAKLQFTFKGGRVLLVTVVGKSPRFVSTKVIMTESKIKLKYSDFAAKIPDFSMFYLKSEWKETYNFYQLDKMLPQDAINFIKDQLEKVINSVDLDDIEF